MAQIFGHVILRIILETIEILSCPFTKDRSIFEKFLIKILLILPKLVVA